MKKIFSLAVIFVLSAICSFGADIRFVQIDSVKYNPNDPASTESFNRLTESVNKHKDIDFVIFSGDNIAKSDPYYLKEFLKSAKNIKAPFYVALGNKDVNKKKGVSKKQYISAYRKNALFKTSVAAPNYVFKKKSTVFIVLDGSKEFVATPNGYYRPETLNWLEKKLDKYSKKNIVILQHFPVIPPSEKEGYLTYKADEYLKIISGRKNVKAIFSGLYNINNEKEINGVMHISTENAPKYRLVDIIECNSTNPAFWSSIVK